MSTEPKQPVLTMFAGINGSGKSTLYTLQKSKYNADAGIRICPDEILLENNGDWQNNKDIYNSGRIAMERIEQCLEEKKSFNWEFTLMSKYALNVLKKAKELDFQTRLNFILVDDINITLKRIENRVKNGGHGIPEHLVRIRFDNQLINLEKALPLIDMAVFFDNIKYLRVVGLATKEQPLDFFDKDTEITHKLLNQIKNTNLSQEK